MEQIPELAACLDSVDGVKALLGGGFLGRRAKKNAAEFARASAKGVARAHGLVGVAIPDHAYEVKVFSTRDAEITADYLESVRAEAQRLAPQYLRAQALFYSGTLGPWQGKASWQREARAFRDLSRPQDDLYCYALSHINNYETTGYVAWAVIDGDLHLVQVADKAVSAILGGLAPTVTWSTGTSITVRK